MSKITYKLKDLQEAFLEALDYCRLYGVDWRISIKPKIKNKTIVGYYVIDETGTTTVANIDIRT